MKGLINKITKKKKRNKNLLVDSKMMVIISNSGRGYFENVHSLLLGSLTSSIRLLFRWRVIFKNWEREREREGPSEETSNGPKRARFQRYKIYSKCGAHNHSLLVGQARRTTLVPAKVAKDTALWFLFFNIIIIRIWSWNYNFIN